MRSNPATPTNGNAIITTVVQTRDDVKWLKLAVQALLDHNGIGLDGKPSASDS